ncbi:MAG: Uncharacterized protein Athens101428_67 [Candidatus Berkelbacteria bacterium Athens1014_28]|uniref:Uncharacterized protein n=1 Tax=Candidatus Berkelbacteria bacterium Athens1014_28 TaxID=2017145 RepID=A0A554LPY4_9BACT|nr:MAG: Uncharacterized protein Athens101428_67 [Candidatus Berkelbacteria bacterium Athens1014_28]
MKVDKKYIWDYDIKTLDLKNPLVLRWYLARKVNFGDYKSLDSSVLKKNLSKLDIDPTLKMMISKYYVNKRTKTSTS